MTCPCCGRKAREAVLAVSFVCVACGSALALTEPGGYSPTYDANPPVLTTVESRSTGSSDVIGVGELVFNNFSISASGSST